MRSAHWQLNRKWIRIVYLHRIHKTVQFLRKLEFQTVCDKTHIEVQVPTEDTNIRIKIRKPHIALNRLKLKNHSRLAGLGFSV